MRTTEIDQREYTDRRSEPPSYNQENLALERFGPNISELRYRIHEDPSLCMYVSEFHMAYNPFYLLT